MMPFNIILIASMVSGGIAILTLVPAQAEVAARKIRPQVLLMAGIFNIVIFFITALISRVSYDNFEGLLVISTFSLVAASTCLGVWLSGEIEKPGHLLPVCLIAAGVDIVSVAYGPSSKVVQDIEEHYQRIAAGIPHLPPLTSYLIMHYPEPGQGLAMMLGVGDVAFFAILAGAVIKMGLPRINILLLAVWGILAVIVSGIFQLAIPALPFIGIGFILTNLKSIKLERIEWVITAVFVVLIIIAGIFLALK